MYEHIATNNDDNKRVTRNFKHQHLDKNNISQFLIFSDKCKVPL